MLNKFPNFLRLVLCVATLACSGLSHARSSIANIDGHATNAFFYASNYESQKEADIAALEGCRVEARKNGIGKLAKKCLITLRGKAPGYGAFTCGDDGCSTVAGYDSLQSAVDAAYSNCSQSYTNCRDKNITNWEDFVGFSKKTVAKASAPEPASCRPRTSSISCKSSCSNGNCIVTYTNGCKMRVQVSPSLDPFTNQWTYPSPSC